MKHASAILIPACLLWLLALTPPLVRADDPETGSTPKIHIKTLEAGAGEPAKLGDKVTIDYTLRLADGTEIGSTYARKRPYTLTVEKGSSIPGMLEAILSLPPGSRSRVTIPAALAYGAAGKPSRKAGNPPVIPPNADLVYEIVVREVLRRPSFPTLDPKASKTTESGLVYWVLDEGAGKPPEVTQRAKLSFAVWNHRRQYVLSTHERRRWVDGQVGVLQLMDQVGQRRIPRERFLAEAAQLMKPGARLFLEVPAELAWGSATPHRLITPDRKSYWELKLIEVGVVPTFSVPPEEELTTTKSGLKYKLFNPGTGRNPTAGSFVRVHYSGWLETGKQFDSSFSRGHPQGFQASRVVPGFKEAILLLREGGSGVFVIPGNLGYGAGGNPRSSPPIPPNATLVFHVELLSTQ